MINLVNDVINHDDLNALGDWVKTNPRLTKGSLTIEFEKQFSEFIGNTHSTFVNSGSSANLAMLYTLLCAEDLKPGYKVCVPALAWATDLAPVLQLGLTPILCDCNFEDLSIDLNHFEELCKTHDIKVLVLVSVLGLVPNMDRIISLCNKYNVILLEDVCESFGSEYKNQKLGTFGAMSSFSTYFGHHFSTIEGGIVSTNSEKYDIILKSIRSHGWGREWNKEYLDEVNSDYEISEFNVPFTFYYPGFNIRSTDLQAFLGLRQIKKLGTIITSRERNFQTYLENISENLWKPLYTTETLISNFAYPIISTRRDEVVKALNTAGIETRPLICGSMEHQPFYKNLYPHSEITCLNADKVHKYGLYVPNHPSLTEEDIKYICQQINI